jgi:hypothetical protein
MVNTELNISYGTLLKLSAKRAVKKVTRFFGISVSVGKEHTLQDTTAPAF